MDPLLIDPAYLTRTLTDLVRIDSTNPTMAEGGAGEAEIAAYVERACAALGLETTILEPVPGRPSVVGVWKGRRRGPALMLNAHLDTVGVEGMDDPFEAAVRGGRLYGRGAQDMKGGLAACLGAIRALRDAGVRLDGDLILTAVADEEHASLGAEAVVEHVRADGAVVTEPTDLGVCVAHKGFVWLRVETTGRAAHGSRPDEGVDANLHMGRVLAALEALEHTFRARPRHPLLGRPSLHAGVLRGGTAPSVYAARCVLDVERRTLPGETADTARAELQTILDRQAAADPAFRADLEVRFDRLPFEADPRGRLVRTAVDAAAALFDARPPLVGQTFWTDAALFAAAGMETIVWGPVGGGLHTREEWVDLASVGRLAAGLAETARRYCGDAEAAR